MLLARIADSVELLRAGLAGKKAKKPKMITDVIFSKGSETAQKADTKEFDSIDDFMKARYGGEKKWQELK